MLWCQDEDEEVAEEAHFSFDPGIRLSSDFVCCLCIVWFAPVPVPAPAPGLHLGYPVFFAPFLLLLAALFHLKPFA